MAMCPEAEVCCDVGEVLSEAAEAASQDWKRELLDHEANRLAELAEAFEADDEAAARLISAG